MSSPNDLITVTMTREAAERFKRALTNGSGALWPWFEQPSTERDKARAEHADWLDWGRSRVDGALREAEPVEAGKQR